jgi:hypothetical protein
MLDIGISICGKPQAGDNITPPLDDYTGAQTAFSLNRKLRTAYSGSAFRIRRDNDNAEQDIGFSGTDVDEAAITTFVGSNSAYVVTVYDQSGNANDWTQATSTKQPLIVNTGTVEKVNSKIAMLSEVLGVDDDLTATLTGSATTTAFHIIKTDRDNICLNNGNNSNRFYGVATNGSGSTNYSNSGTPTTHVNGSSILTTRDALHDAIINIQCICTLTSLDLSDSLWSGFHTDYTSSTTFAPPTYIQETIIYDSDKSSDRVAIETNINEYYTIY